MAVRPTGMLIQKMDRQPAVETSMPPSTGPRAMDTPTTAPHTPTACARSLGSVKVLVMIDMATGLSIDPPTACSMRNTTRRPRLGARLQSSDPAEKTVRPRTNVRLRPNRSAMEPDSMSKLARTSV